MNLMKYSRAFVSDQISVRFRNQTTVTYNIRCGTRTEIDTSYFSHILNVSFICPEKLRVAQMNFMHAEPCMLYASQLLDHFDFKGDYIDTKVFRNEFTEVNFYFENVVNTDEYVKVFVTVANV